MNRHSLQSNDRIDQEIAAVLADIAAHSWPSEVAEARALYDRMGPPIASDIRSESLSIGSTSALLLIPPDCDAGRIVLFLHGGGYTYGSPQSHGGLAAEIARAAECRCLLLDYRLAPEHPFPAAVEDACAACEWILLQGFQSARTGLIGDSAGGGLVLAALVAQREKSRPFPGACVCLSPWVDLEALGESYHSRAHLDPMIERSLVMFLSNTYMAGKDPRLPTASPIHADFRGFPPMLIQVGEHEVLYSEAQHLADKARAAGVEVIFEEWTRMVHVWHLYYPVLTAGREAITRIGAFVKARTQTPCRPPALAAL
jgi:epsilon-lactone hydrolase